MKIVILANNTSLDLAPNKNRTLIEECVEMFDDFSNGNLYIQTPIDLTKDIEKLVGTKAVIMSEPKAKGTAPALGLALEKISKENPEEILTIAYSDHPVNYKHKLISALKITEQIADNSKKIVLIAVNPTYPATNYGYAKIGKVLEERNGKIAFEMVDFKEKPELEHAKKFLMSWRYLWNTGYMTVRADVLMKHYKNYLPEISKGLSLITQSEGTSLEKEIINKVFDSFEKISIDKGIYEKIDKKEIIIVPVDLNIDDFDEN